MPRNTVQTANITLSQLGGNRFIAMTGAKNCYATENGLQFQLPKAKDGINRVVISLEDNDTYKVTFSRVRRVKGEFRLKEIKSVSDVYADMLADVFTDATGLYTRL